MPNSDKSTSPTVRSVSTCQVQPRRIYRAKKNINAQEKELCTTSSLASMYGASVT